MTKLACVFSFEKSNWVSCQKIVFNLHKAYENLENVQLENFNLSKEMELKDVKELAAQIFQSNPDTIIFLDHRPHPILLVAFLLMLYQDRKLPRIVFHLFGDFSLEYSKWGKMSQMLKGNPVDFITPSPRQQLFFDRFLKKSQSSHLCHFPVNENEFFYRPELRTQQRLDWGVREHERVFIFTGRLSRQKRIHTLIKAFAKAFERENPSHLFLYGNPDSISDPFVGRWEVEGEYFRAIHRMYARLPQHIRKNIHFMGNVSHAELIPVYQGADVFVNLSVHNDEDFGMSVAESQCSGLPTILTSWGGLAAFHYPEFEKASIFLPVRIGSKSKLISITKTIEAMKSFELFNHDERANLSSRALKKFGIQNASGLVQNILNQEPRNFTGFNSYFEKVASDVDRNGSRFITKSKKINSLYKDLYGVYA